jgi:pSer/pThr/pTyr-binding forkhead associated (FHA) protein
MRFAREVHLVDANGPAGSMAIVDARGSLTITVPMGTGVVVGSDPTAAVHVADPRVSWRHALVVRDGPGWLVTSLDPANPIRILDETGRPHPVLGELGLRSGTLLAGTTQLLLYPPTP